MKNSVKGFSGICFIVLLSVLPFLAGCEKDEATNSVQNKEYRCGTSLPAGFHCISNAGASVLTTYKVPEIIGCWDENVSDFCIEYRSDGTGTITFKPSGFSQGSVQRIKWGAMVKPNGDFQLSGQGTIYICHESLDGSLDPQIAMLSFKQSSRQWYGYDLKKVSSCGTAGGGGSSNGTGKIVFWVNKDFGCGPITVNMNGQSGTISQYYSSSPACGASGSANFTLPAGNYSFTASCSSFNWGPTQVTIKEGGCLKMRLGD